MSAAPRLVATIPCEMMSFSRHIKMCLHPHLRGNAPTARQSIQHGEADEHFFSRHGRLGSGDVSVMEALLLLAVLFFIQSSVICPHQQDAR